MSRIKVGASARDTIVAMSEGNPGCLSFLASLMQPPYPDGTVILFILDKLEIYGSRAYMLWNDCCDRDRNEVERVLLSYMNNLLSADDINANLNQGRGTPFESLLPLEELRRMTA